MANDVKATKVEKIVISLAGTSVELSPDQAKELRDILIGLLGRGTKDNDFMEELKRLAGEQEKIVPVPYLYPQPYPVYPLQ
jgi:hypothetical protein